jgi:crotonobetainyl-CoA:carnitine CoA-transferase CaiB-like acyl-CoA transferase
LHKLAGTADAVMNNLRGDLPARLGLDYASLAKLKPSLVCAHLSAYGRDNDRSDWPGYDYLMQAEAGYLHLTGEPDSPPSRMGLSIVDYMTGITTATGLLAALIGAVKTGVGRDVDVSLFDVAMAQLTYPAAWYLNSGHLTERVARSAHPSTVPCQLVKCSDGWLFVMCMTPKFWQRLCDGLDHAEWLSDNRFACAKNRLENREQLSDLLDTAFSAHSTQHWLTVFQGTLPISPVLRLPQALDNPFARTVGMIGEVAAHDGSALQMVCNPVRIDGDRLPRKACSTLSADTAVLLSEVGYSNNEIHSLRQEGVV